MIRLPEDTVALGLADLDDAAELGVEIVHVVVSEAIALDEGTDTPLQALLENRGAADVVVTGRLGVDALKRVDGNLVRGSADRQSVLLLGEPVTVRREALAGLGEVASVDDLIEALVVRGVSLAVVSPDGTVLPAGGGDR